MNVIWHGADIKGGTIVTSRNSHPGGERWIISYRPAHGAPGNVFALTSLRDGLVTEFVGPMEFAQDLTRDDMWPEEWLK